MSASSAQVAGDGGGSKPRPDTFLARTGYGEHLMMELMAQKVLLSLTILWRQNRPEAKWEKRRGVHCVTLRPWVCHGLL